MSPDILIEIGICKPLVTNPDKDKKGNHMTRLMQVYNTVMYVCYIWIMCMKIGKQEILQHLSCKQAEVDFWDETSHPAPSVHLATIRNKL